jgi:acetyl esterase
VPDPNLRSDPRMNFAKTDPALFPPLFLAAAELDALRGGSENLARRLEAAGRPHQLKIYPGMTHMFFGYSRSVDRARECIDDIAAFLRANV